MAAREKIQSVGEYLRNQPRETQVRLNAIRMIVRRLAPDAVERISYRMPAYFLNGALVWFAAFKNHIGFYPGASGVAAFRHEIENYKSAKGSIQFPLDQPLPTALIKRIVKYRVQENLARENKKE